MQGVILGMQLVSRDTKYLGQGGWPILGMYLLPLNVKYSRTGVTDQFTGYVLGVSQDTN